MAPLPEAWPPACWGRVWLAWGHGSEKMDGKSYLLGHRNAERAYRRSIKTTAAYLYRNKSYPPPKNPRTNEGKLRQYDYCISLAFQIIDGQNDVRCRQSLDRSRKLMARLSSRNPNEP